MYHSSHKVQLACFSVKLYNCFFVYNLVYLLQEEKDNEGLKVAGLQKGK